MIVTPWMLSLQKESESVYPKDCRLLKENGGGSGQWPGRKQKLHYLAVRGDLNPGQGKVCERVKFQRI
jgi:hypothetical protein